MMQFRMVRSGGGYGWPDWLSRIVGGHWFRVAHKDQDASVSVLDPPCAFNGCGRPGREHWRWSGEWMLPRWERWRLSLHRLFS